MFGATLNAMWAITYTRKGCVFYLSDSVGSTAYVWSQRKNKAKRYATEPAATDMAETVRKTHTNKKIDIKVTQV